MVAYSKVMTNPLSKIKFLFRNSLGFLFLAGFIGACSSFGAILFRHLISLFQDLLWPGAGDFLEQVIKAPWWWRLLLPALAGLLVGPIIFRLAPELKGPGVPEVIAALVRRQGRLRHRVTFLKALVTSLLLGAGASVGREGPVVQIGASIGSSITQLLGLPSQMVRVGLACGAAAGIAATFNAPITGTLFAVEVILFDLEISHLSHILIAGIVAAVLAQMMWGGLPALKGAYFWPGPYPLLLVYLLIGLLAGFVGNLFVRLIYGAGDVWDRLPGPVWIKPALGGLCLGALALILPEVMGVGYETVNAALSQNLPLKLAAVLLVAKILATSLCLGSGMSGGIFAPSLVTGACLGTAISLGLNHLGFSIIPSNGALIGMGAMVAATTLAPMTAILTIFELTYEPKLILPLMLACVASVTVVRKLKGYSAYEMKLLKRGYHIVRGHDINILRSIPITEYLRPLEEVLYVDTKLEEVLRKALESPYPHFVVLSRHGHLKGVLSLRDLRPALPYFDELRPLIVAADLMTIKVLALPEEATLADAFEVFERRAVSFLPVVSKERPLQLCGIIKRDDVLAAYHQKVLKDRILSCGL